MRLILFDCDGTLVDSQVMIVAAMTRAFASAGLAPPPREEALSIVGLSLPIAVARLAVGHPEATITALVEAYRAAFHDLRTSTSHHEPLYPGAREAIATLAERSDTLLGVVTGKSRRGLEAILALHGLSAFFQVTVTADDAPSKPHPQMVLDAMAAVGVDAPATAVVGDTSFDMEMARAAGAAALGVSWGYHPVDRLVRAGAGAVVHRYGAVPGALDDLLGKAM